MPEYLSIILAIVALIYGAFHVVGIWYTIKRPELDRHLALRRIDTDYALHRERLDHDSRLFDESERTRKDFFEREIRRMIGEIVAQRGPDG